MRTNEERTFTKLKNKEYRDAASKYMLETMICFQVRAMREDRGWSQAELAERIGTTQSAIARVEKGDRLPTLNTLLKLASAFDVALVGYFSSFTKWMVETEDLSPRRLAVQPFNKETQSPASEMVRTERKNSQPSSPAS